MEITCWVMIWFFRFCLKSSKEMPWRLGRLFQVFHRVQMHFLAHFVEPLDHFGIGGDAQVLALFEQQLLVDQITQNVLVPLGDDLVGIGRVLLLGLLFQLILAAHVFAAGNNLIINAGYNFLDHRVGRRKRRQGSKTNQQ